MNSVKTEITPSHAVKLLRMLSLDQQAHILYGNPDFGGNVVMLPKNGNRNDPELVVMDTDDNKKRAIDFRFGIMEETCKDMASFFWMINKADRLTVLHLFSNIGGMNGEYESILKDAWVSTEFPHQTAIPQLIAMFKRADCNKMMDGADKKKLAELPDEITIYRGLQDKRAKRKGLSWSLSYDKALWFATRWNSPDARVLEARIKKKDVFIYTNQRSEEEVVVDPGKLKGIRNVEINSEKVLEGL
jgi:hypothetical protein